MACGAIAMPEVVRSHSEGLGGSQSSGLRTSIQVNQQDFAVQEQQGGERLVWGGGGHMFACGRKSQEGFDFGDVHLAGMAFVVEEDVAPDPVAVAFVRAWRVVSPPDSVLYLVKKFLGAWFQEGSPICALHSAESILLLPDVRLACPVSPMQARFDHDVVRRARDAIRIRPARRH
jgi:hypothetical protein